jgi:ferredoxin
MDTTDDPKKISDLDEKTRTKPGTLRRIVVDRTKCIGARSCVAVAPGVFQMDDQNLAYLVDPDSEDEDTIMLAAQSCPVLAVIIYDDQGKQIFPEE